MDRRIIIGHFYLSDMNPAVELLNSLNDIVEKKPSEVELLDLDLNISNAKSYDGFPEFLFEVSYLKEESLEEKSVKLQAKIDEAELNLLAAKKNLSKLKAELDNCLDKEDR